MTLESFSHDLHEALSHLQDPDFRAADSLYRALQMGTGEGAAALQAELSRQIEALMADPVTPVTSPIRQDLNVVYQRFVLRLTQTEAADELGMSVRTLQRVQRRGVYLLARILWERQQQLAPRVPAPPTSPDQPEVVQSGGWHAQLQEELAALHESEEARRADLRVAIEGVLKLGEFLAASRGVQVRIDMPLGNGSAAIHLSALRQLLITILHELIASMAGGEIHLQVTHTGAQIVVHFDMSPNHLQTLPDNDLIRAILVTYGGTLSISESKTGSTLDLGLPAAARAITVLVVDDNADLVHFYRHFAADTPYHIVHLADAGQLFATIQAERPGVVVLDVMLPGVDGWELLAYLHQHPDTRSIPVIVCSVVRSAELAIALGAALYLPKPVRRQEFIQALDQVIAQTQRAAEQPAENNAPLGPW